MNGFPYLRMNLKGATALITGRSAGIGTFKALVDTDRGSFDAVFATNVTTSTVCSTASPWICFRAPGHYVR